MNARFRHKRISYRRNFSAWTSALAAALCVGATAAATCPFDTGGSDAINDGVVLTRYALGITGAPMTASTRYASLDPLQVKANIECVGCALDMNGDNQIDSVDATIIARHLAGFTGAAVTNGLALGAGSRNTTAAVTSFLANGCAVGGAINAFVQGGNSFGAPGVIGTNDAQPLTVKSGGTAVSLVNQRGDGLRVSFASSSPNTINGAYGNVATAGVHGATISGGGTAPGFPSMVTGNYGTVAGGYENTAYTAAVVSGGVYNFAGGPYSTVSGGYANSIALSGNSASITGGSQNSASGGNSAIVGGYSNDASGVDSAIVGGRGNIASGVRSFASGLSASADKDGTFVWADNSTSTPFKVTTNFAPGFGANSFNVRATGGVIFATQVNATTGAPTVSCFYAATYTGWNCTSDRNVKERIVPITPSRVLAGVLAMPVSTWSIIGSKFRQMGPMAQDFYRAFGLGDTDKAINSIDASGVAFAAIQGLNKKLADEVKSLRSRLAAKDEEAAQLKGRVSAADEAAARVKLRLAAIEKKLGL